MWRRRCCSGRARPSAFCSEAPGVYRRQHRRGRDRPRDQYRKARQRQRMMSRPPCLSGRPPRPPPHPTNRPAVADRRYRRWCWPSLPPSPPRSRSRRAPRRQAGTEENRQLAQAARGAAVVGAVAVAGAGTAEGAGTGGAGTCPGPVARAPRATGRCPAPWPPPTMRPPNGWRREVRLRRHHAGREPAVHPQGGRAGDVENGSPTSYRKD
jgi:hypothetical protein